MNFRKSLYLCTRKRNKDNYNNILKINDMKRMILFSLMALMTIAAFGRKHAENATL